MFVGKYVGALGGYYDVVRYIWMVTTWLTTVVNYGIGIQRKSLVHIPSSIHPSLAWSFSGCRFTLAGDLQPVEETKWGQWRTWVRVIVLKGLKTWLGNLVLCTTWWGLYGRTPLNIWVVHILATFLTDWTFHPSLRDLIFCYLHEGVGGATTSDILPKFIQLQVK